MRPSKYPTDLSDAEWACLKPCLLAPKKRGRGRPKVHSPRKILNAVFYLLKSGCPWRLLPRDFPPAVEDRLPLVQKMAYTAPCGDVAPPVIDVTCGCLLRSPVKEDRDTVKRVRRSKATWGNIIASRCSLKLADRPGFGAASPRTISRPIAGVRPALHPHAGTSPPVAGCDRSAADSRRSGPRP